MNKFVTAALGAATLFTVAQPAQAAVLTGTFNVTVSEGLTSGGGFSAAKGNPFSGRNTASATFTYTGGINFSNTTAQGGVGGDLNSAFGFSTSNISGYGGDGTVVYQKNTIANFSSLNDFLGSSGSAANYPYGSYFTFDLGTLVAGTVLTILHDDGAAIFQNGVQVGTMSTGPTPAVTDVVTLTKTANTVLRYTRQNGTPSVLRVDIAAVPEPATWAMMMLGFGTMGFVMRRKSAATRIRFA